MSDNKLIEINNLKKYFDSNAGVFGKAKAQVKAVDGLSFFINEGETLGLVGESGCGKSTTGRLILRLIDPTDGEVIFNGQDITKLRGKKRRELTRDMQIIFQDPYSSLNPRMTVEHIISEPLRVHGIGSRRDHKQRVKELLNVVGLPAAYRDRYPHEFSGGQRQRIGIARALALNPKFIVCDEPVSALDVSVQSQVINLINELQAEFGLTYLFIAHGLNVVKYISDRVGVMYLGKMVELSDSDEIYKNPLHPYTKALLSAIPVPDPDAKTERVILEGDVPSPTNPPKGCRFHTRCVNCMEKCKEQEPQYREAAPGHYVACHLYHHNT